MINTKAWYKLSKLQNFDFNCYSQFNSLEHSGMENVPPIQAFPGSLNAGIFLLPIVCLV